MTQTTAPEPGIYHGISMEDYLSWDYFHKSLVAPTLKSAKHLKLAKEQNKTSEAMLIGSLVDALLLDPDDLKRFEMTPETYINSKTKEMPWNMNSKTCKADYQAIIDSGKVPIKLEDMTTARAIQAGALENETAAEMIAAARKQVTIVWDDPDTGVRCKARIDLQLPDCLGDLKTTKNAEKYSFRRDIANLGYHIQGASYTEGWSILNGGLILPWKFVAVENVEPYCCAIYDLDENSLAAGAARYHTALARYKDYMDSDPELTRGYSQFAEPISIPKWEEDQAFRAAEDADVSI